MRIAVHNRVMEDFQVRIILYYKIEEWNSPVEEPELEGMDIIIERKEENDSVQEETA